MIEDNERLKNYSKFFIDQVKQAELDFKATYGTSVSLLYSREIITFGYISSITSGGLVVIKFPRNHAPRLKVLKSITLVTKSAKRDNGNSVKDWNLTLEQFFTEGAYHTRYSDLVPQYYVNDPSGYDAVACGGVSLKLFNIISNSLQKGKQLTALVFDSFPPVDYYLNIDNYLLTHYDNKELLLEPKISYDEWKPEELSYNPNDELGITNKVYDSLLEEGTVILQGPPGTGKSFTIANIISRYLDEGKSVCATSMANKGLIELIKQRPLEKYKIDGKISKTHLSADERHEVNGVKDAIPSLVIPGGELLCATNYALSGVYSKKNIEEQMPPSYDLVVIEEASQAFLSTIIAFKDLGKQCLIVGDPMQLPPIVKNANCSLYKKWKVDLQTNGLETYALSTNTKSFRIMSTFRLTPDSAKLTSVFYGNNFHSVQKDRPDFSSVKNNFIPEEGGGLYCCTNDFTNGVYSKTAVGIIGKVINNIFTANSEMEVAIISPFKDTVKHLQQSFLTEEQMNTLVIETIDRIQGMTVDYTIFYVPGRNVSFAFDVSRFNVATSRSKSTTLIITDVPVENFHTIDGRVIKYLEGCKRIFPDGRLLEPLSPISNSSEDTSVQKLSDLGVKVIGKIDLTKFEKPKKEIKKDKENIYVIDTNVFVNCPDIISRIDKKYKVVLSAKVIDELDHLKIKLDADGVRNVQKALRNINQEIDRRDIKMELTDLSLLPQDFDKRSADNNILTVLLKYKDNNPILLTSDNGLQIKAKGLGLTTISLRKFLKER